MEYVEKIKIRNYDAQIHRAKVEDLQRRCEVGPKEHVFLYTDDPVCRIRNSPIYIMLVAELNNDEIVGLVQGSIKIVRFDKPSKLGYILGLRVSPHHRRKGIGSMLVNSLEQWFVSNNVDLSYMATEKDNEASVLLFINKHGYIKFRSPSILVHPVNNGIVNKSSSNIEIMKLDVSQAEFLYRNFMGSAEFFPQDIDKILRNRLSLGTWVAYYKNDEPSLDFGGIDDQLFGVDNGLTPKSWAMVSVWNSGGLFKLRVGQAPFSCLFYAKASKLLHMVMPCLNVPTLPEFDDPFGFYFMYGVHKQGPSSGKLVTALCRFVHNLATQSQDCKVVVTEIIGGCDNVKPHIIPHLKLLSCLEDWWCIKAMKDEEVKTVQELTNTSPTRELFVDPREV